MGENNPFPGPYTKYKVNNKFVGLIIGKNGETVKQLHQQTGSFIFIPKESKAGEDFRWFELSGSNVDQCIKKIENLIENVSIALTL
jgi:transcription antitermination factor NusA-like protein